MELENSQNNSLAKLPMLKLGEYEMWENQELKLHQNSGPSTALKIDLCLLLVKKRFARRMMSKLEVFSSWHSQMNISLPLTSMLMLNLCLLLLKLALEEMMLPRRQKALTK
ncbi:hypothetical protein Tco_0978262 [Tanacetum coccineum]|uniref:Uncharacterized protein n=1 Tax=Tanacetum coccineum TaxID=301880 RepID=A0ABQ5EMJ6_9ASTR